MHDNFLCLGSGENKVFTFKNNNEHIFNKSFIKKQALVVFVKMHQMTETFPDYLAPPAGNIVSLYPVFHQGLYVYDDLLEL